MRRRWFSASLALVTWWPSRAALHQDINDDIREVAVSYLSSRDSCLPPPVSVLYRQRRARI
jgi:hypothetical protein